MKYTTDEAIEQIDRRRRHILLEDRRRRSALFVASGCLFAAWLCLITALAERIPVAYPGSVYGSFLLGREAGGYVIASLLSFALGVTVTLLCLRYRR